MRGQDFSHVEALARLCAERGLRLRDARRLFEELYLADALWLSGGRVVAAADRVGLTTGALCRRRRAREADAARRAGAA